MAKYSIASISLLEIPRTSIAFLTGLKSTVIYPTYSLPYPLTFSQRSYSGIVALLFALLEFILILLRLCNNRAPPPRYVLLSAGISVKDGLRSGMTPLISGYVCERLKSPVLLATFPANGFGENVSFSEEFFHLF